MGLVLNGPFRTTPAREMIGLTDEFNKMLLVEAADLVKELLRQEKRQKRTLLADRQYFLNWYRHEKA